MSSHEQEILERKAREAERWWNSLSRSEKEHYDWVYQNPLDDPWSCWAIISGFATLKDGHLVLTGEGELYLHQLKLREWIENKRREKAGLPPLKSPIPKRLSMFD